LPERIARRIRFQRSHKTPASSPSDLIIRPLGSGDLDQALRLSTVVGWNQRLDDWRMLLRLPAARAFAAFLDARDRSIIGTSIGIDYGGFAWIAMMLVDPAYRGRGIGRRLLETAIDAVPAQVPIRLDATPHGRPLYQQYGFQDEAFLSRYVVERDAAIWPNAAVSPAIRRLTSDDLPLVITQDRETFGGTRDALLDWIFRAAPEYAYATENDDRRVHYCLGRQGRVFDQIGPVIAGNDDVAHALVKTALASAGDRRVVIDVYDRHHAFAAALRDAGFVVERPLVRMRRPAPSGACDRPVAPGNVREFAILGPEFA
jgi:GNAT superfamily N-acetyltransferase